MAIEYPVLRNEALPPLSGTPGITQSVYGQRGNLELVCPDPLDGFWVFWLNADATDQKQGAAQNRWSGGLHIESGTTMSAVSIRQVRYGPNSLEAVAVECDASGRESEALLIWSPERGFVRSETPPPAQPLRPNAPESWNSAIAIEGLGRRFCVGRTAAGVVQLGEFSEQGDWTLSESDLGNADTLAACWSSLEEGVVEIITRTDTCLDHLRWSPHRREVIQRESPVRSLAWVDHPTPTLRRTVQLG